MEQFDYEVGKAYRGYEIWRNDVSDPEEWVAIDGMAIPTIEELVKLRNAIDEFLIARIEGEM